MSTASGILAALSPPPIMRSGIAKMFASPPPPPLPSVWIDDGIGMRYIFTEWPKSWAVPSRKNAVYAFVNVNGLPGYIGKAEDLADRLSGHEKRPLALFLGYDRLFFHVPGPSDRIHYMDVERRLIKRLCPPLNDTFNWLKRLG